MKYYALDREIKDGKARSKYKLYEDDKLILKLDLPFSLEEIGEDIALFKRGGYGDDEEIQRDIIFDLKNGKVICDRFNKIYSFKDYNGKKYALADIYLKNDNRVITISCFIDIMGNIVSKVIDNRELNPFDAIYLDKHIEYLKACLESEEKQFNDLKLIMKKHLS